MTYYFASYPKGPGVGWGPKHSGIRTGYRRGTSMRGMGAAAEKGHDTDLTQTVGHGIFTPMQWSKLGILGGPRYGRYAGSFRDNYAMPKYIVEEPDELLFSNPAVQDINTGKNVLILPSMGADGLGAADVPAIDHIHVFAAQAVRDFLSRAASVPEQQRIPWLVDSLNQIEPGLAASFTSQRQELLTGGQTPAIALREGLQQALEAYAVNQIVSGKLSQKVRGGTAGLGSVAEVGSWLSAVAGRLDGNLTDVICSPQALNVIPAALQQRGADPTLARQRVEELQQSCTEHSNPADTEQAASTVRWGLIAAAALGVGYLLWRSNK
jgi:hypothetical protein